MGTGYRPRFEFCKKADDPLLRIFADVAAWTYRDCQGIRDGSWDVSDQQLDCGIAFQGTSSMSEFLTSVAISFEDFCGEPRVHHGIASELRSIFRAFGREIKETLRHCAKVYSIGHSMGGGLAEAFAFCANRHDPHNADYRLIGFDKDDKPTKLEEIDLTTCRGGRVLSK